jgi:hypothetical protein
VSSSYSGYEKSDKNKGEDGRETITLEPNDLGIPGKYRLVPFFSETSQLIDRMSMTTTSIMSETLLRPSADLSGTLTLSHIQKVSPLLKSVMSFSISANLTPTVKMVGPPLSQSPLETISLKARCVEGWCVL